MNGKTEDPRGEVNQPDGNKKLRFPNSQPRILPTILPPFPISNIYHKKSQTYIEQLLDTGHKNEERKIRNSFDLNSDERELSREHH